MGKVQSEEMRKQCGEKHISLVLSGVVWSKHYNVFFQSHFLSLYINASLNMSPLEHI